MERIDGERGQTMAEYGVMLAVITVGIIAAVATLSGAAIGALNRAADLIF